MPYPVAPGDTVRVAFEITDANGAPYDPTPDPTVSVRRTSTALVHTTPITGAAMARGTPTLVGTYYYTLAVSSSETEGVGLDVILNIIDTNVPALLRTRTKSFIVQTDLLQELGDVGVTLVSPIDSITGDITLIRGDSYLTVDDRDLRWTSTDWTPFDLSTATDITLKLKSKYPNATVIEYEATAVSDTIVKVELTSANTNDLTVGECVYDFDLQATLANESIITLVRGKVNVVRDVRAS